MEFFLLSELAQVAERLRRSTVAVRSRGPGGGTGVIWDDQGTIITNAHVARGSEAIVETEDERTFDAEIIARDERLDLATLKIDATGLHPAPIGDSDALRVGQLVIAVGNPLGMTGAVATGIIHAIVPGRPSFVRADIRLLPGNSGGPLADVHGRVVGINSMVAGGLGMAVPSNTVQRFLGGRVNLGVTARPVQVPVAGQPGLGLLVLDVAPNSAADAAGLAIGDVVIGVDGELFRTPREIGSVDWGAPHDIDLIRGGRTIRFTVTVTEATQRAA
jgi:serine protease Do